MRNSVRVRFTEGVPLMRPLGTSKSNPFGRAGWISQEDAFPPVDVNVTGGDI